MEHHALGVQDTLAELSRASLNEGEQKTLFSSPKQKTRPCFKDRVVKTMGYHMDAACFYRSSYVLWELPGVIPGRSALLGAVCRLLLGILGYSGQCNARKAGRFPSCQQHHCLGSFWAATEEGGAK